MSVLKDKQDLSAQNMNQHVDHSAFFASTKTLAGNKSENDDWVTTYMDLITLLLTLFIVLLAYSSQSDEAAFSETTKAISEPLQGADIRDTAAEITVEQDAFGDALIEHLSSTEFAGKMLSFQRAGDEVEIQLDSEILFGSGDAMLTKNALEQLQSLSAVLADPDYFISIEGHTDNIPINTPRYPSNWELSSARASSVARFLINREISDSRIRVIGYADSRPIGSNFSEAGRKLNRRVTLVISEHDK